MYTLAIPSVETVPMSDSISSLCVYCGSHLPDDDAHRAAATALGDGLARRGIRLVYGGGHVGMMGLVADAALAAGGEVVGVIPDFLKAREVHHQGVREMVTVDSMHARKQRMFELADAFAVLPGGTGTLDETIEIITWKQLALHDKPIFLVDIGGYWQPFRDLLAAAADAGYVAPATFDLFATVADIDALFAALAGASPGGRAPDSRRL